MQDTPKGPERAVSPADDPDTRRRVTAALEASRIGVFEFEPQTNKAFWDDRVRELWGIPAGEEITYETVIAQVHQDDHALHDGSTEMALDPAGPGEMDMEYRVIPRNGDPMRWVHARATCTFEGQVPVRLLGTVEDVTERHMFENRNKVLMNELQHRVKNTLATVISIIKLSADGTQNMDEYVESLEARLLSMSRAHSVLTRNDWSAVDIRDILNKEFDAFVGPDSEALRYSGPGLLIPAQHVQTMSMAIHELLTNAMKHGGLSVGEGHVEIETRHDDETASFIWRECCTSEFAVNSKPSGGFGSFLLGQVLSAALGAKVAHEITPQGALFKLDFPLASETAA